MAKSPPSSPFYWNDYYRDTRLLSPTARGIWMDILCLLHESGRRGKMTLTMEQWLRWVTCPQALFEQSLQEIHEQEVGDVTFGHNQVTPYVTVENRRMSREEKSRKDDRLRKQRERGHGHVTGNVTPPVTRFSTAPSSSSSSSSSSSDDYLLKSLSGQKVDKEQAETILKSLSPTLKKLMADKVTEGEELDALKEPNP